MLGGTKEHKNLRSLDALESLTGAELDGFSQTNTLVVSCMI